MYTKYGEENVQHRLGLHTLLGVWLLFSNIYRTRNSWQEKFNLTSGKAHKYSDYMVMISIAY